MTGFGWLNGIAVALGGAVGAVARFTLTLWVKSRVDALAGREIEYPLGTLLANLLGCFLLGLLMQIHRDRSWLPEAWQLALTTGLLGALTTFSTFMVETLSMLERREWLAAGGYWAISLLVGLLAAACGVWLARWLAA